MIGKENLAKEIKTKGLKITDLKGNSFQLPPNEVNYTTDLNDLSACGIIFITLKSADTESVAQQLKTILAPKTIVVSFQNGVRNAEVLSQNLPNCQVLAGMVPYNVVKTAEGTFHNGTSGELVFAEKGEASALVLSILQKAHLEAFTHPDMQGVLWGKLLINLNNAINALAGVPLREELGNSLYRRIVADAISEGLKTLRVAGIKVRRLGKMIPQIAPFIMRLPDWLFFRIAAGMVKIDPQARSSMWEDLQKGRKTEIDYLNGEIVKLGQALNFPTPINSAIIQLIKTAENQGLGSPQIKAEELDKKIRSGK
jgi:2-dehydropantoate 2-reductase